MNTPLIIGLIGGIGAGKSAVANEFVRRGGRLLAADPLGHEALRQPDIRGQLVQRFGADIVDASGEIDRRKLAGIVFAEEEKRQWLEALVHPYIRRRLLEAIAEATRDEVRLIVLDAAVLLEAGWNDMCHRIVYVDAPAEMRRQRVEQSRGWSAQDWARREAAQLPLTTKRSHADHVIDNSQSLEDLSRQIDELMHQWGLVQTASPRSLDSPKHQELSRYGMH
jgi:dephospho-CoA kinase